MFKNLFHFFVLMVMTGVVGCIEPSAINESQINSSGIAANQEIIDYANQLLENYEWKLNIIKELQNRTDLLGSEASKDAYINDMKNKYNEAIDNGDALAAYINENRDKLEEPRASDILLWIAKNKAISENNIEDLKNLKVVIEKPMNQEVLDHANQLFDDYSRKNNLTDEIQIRIDALGSAATKEMYIEWIKRNNEAIDSGDALTAYINKNRDKLNQHWTIDVLKYVAVYKMVFETNNQALKKTISSIK
jgi:predicted DNA-binding protein YlxM (UPF0122 family)